MIFVPSVFTAPRDEQKFNLECSFENNFCDWKNPDESADLKWLRKNGIGIKYGDGPLNDVTLKTSQGYYAYVKALDNVKSTIAYLQSIEFSYNNVSCLEFYYQLGGPINSQLSLLVIDSAINNKTIIWQRLGNRGDNWRHAYVSVPAYDNKLKKLEFQGRNLFFYF